MFAISPEQLLVTAVPRLVGAGYPKTSVGTSKIVKKQKQKKRFSEY